MKLHIYFTRRFLFGLLSVFLVFVLLAASLEMIETMRRFARADLRMVEIFRLTGLRLPISLYELFPLIMILATLSVFRSLAKSSELVVARASGRSAMHCLVAPLIAAFVVGLLLVGIFNPIVAGTSKSLEAATNRYLKGNGSALSISAEGLWLRQGSDGGQIVINAKKSNGDGTELQDVTFFGYSVSGEPEFRVNAARASLTERAWATTGAKIWRFDQGTNSESEAVFFEEFAIPTSLTREQIQDGFGHTSTIPIWKLPAFIEKLKVAGFSSRRHEIWFQVQLSIPVFLIAMVLIGAAFSLRHSRSNKPGVMILLALIMGFGLFFIRNFSMVLGESGQIPVLLAAWAPPIAGILMALGLLLHTEDG